MNCLLFAILGLGLLGGSFAISTMTQEQHTKLRTLFSKELANKYDDIVKERRNHYIIGIVLGIIISFIVIKNSNISNYLTRMAIFLSITLGSGIIIYMILPKSDYVLNHLKSPEENKKWLEVHQYMKNRYFIGFGLGILAALLFGNIICKE